MRFIDRIYRRIKIKNETVPFRRTYGSINIRKKTMKKIVEDLELDSLVEPKFSVGAASSLLYRKMMEPNAWL